MTAKGAGETVSRRLAPVLVGVLLSIPLVTLSNPQSQSTAAAPGEEAGGTELPNFSLPRGHFTENRGQIDGGIRYYSTGNPAVGFREDGLVFVVREEESSAELGHDLGDLSPASSASRSLAYRVHFEGARRIAPFGEDPLPFRSNFFLGNDPAEWRTDVPSYTRIVYEGLYEGIDLAFQADDGGVKYEFRVHPGSDPATIRLRYEGVRSLRVVDAELLVDTALGEIRDSDPYSYQDLLGGIVNCDFALRAPFTLGFDCEEWEASRTLIIDPLVYATYVGGGGDDRAYGMTVDASGNAYATGRTSSMDFPVSFGFDMTFNGSADAFLVKLDPSGSYIRYATFIGGSAEDYGWAVAVDTGGYAFLTAWTYSSDFPTTPGALNIPGSVVADAWVAKLGPGGNRLEYSAVFGGNGFDEATDIKLDSDGNAYVTGHTYSTDFPTTPGAFDSIFNGVEDSFIAKLNAAGTAFAYSTLLGGSLQDGGLARLVLDSSHNAYVAGHTQSWDFPTTPGAYDSTLNGPSDGYVAKLDVTGSALVYATFLGGSSSESAWGGIALDAIGRAWVVGMTASANFPTTLGAFDTSFGGGPYDGFVAALSATGDALLFGSFLGDADADWATSIGLDSRGDVYVSGWTHSSGFPVTPDAIDTTYNGGRDGFVARFTPISPSALIFSTFIGGSLEDFPMSMALDFGGAVYVSGMTDSRDFPVTPSAANRTYLGGPEDGFVLKLHASPPLPDLQIESSMIFLSPPGPANVGDSVTIDAIVRNVGDDNASQVAVRFHDGAPSGSNHIGADVTIPFLWHPGFDLASKSWQAATPAGTHDLCVVVDPDDRIAERSESNNEACASIEVVVPPRPDYVSTDPLPPPPIRIGLSVPLGLSLGVRNEGNNPGAGNAIVAFFNASTPGQPFATTVVPPLNPSETSAAAAVWTAPGTPGFYSVVAAVDYLDDIAESNETNNEHAWTIEVIPAPFTLLQVGAPSYSAGTTYLRSSTPVHFMVIDPGGTGIRATMYRIDGGPWVNYTATGSFTILGEGEHRVQWYSEDFVGNAEATQSELLRVDDTPPRTTITVGDPRYTIGGTFVTSSTPIALASTDRGITAVGVAFSEFRIDLGPWLPYGVPFTVSGEGMHAVAYRSVDWLGNAEFSQPVTILVDDTPPSTGFLIGDPKYVMGGTFVTSSTPISLAASDGGVTPVGGASVEYQIDGGPWINYVVPFTFSGEGMHRMEYRSSDRLGNLEAVRDVIVVVDDSPPNVSSSVGEPKFSSVQTFITSRTLLTLTAADAGLVPVGLAGIKYRIGEGPLTPYLGPFPLPSPDGGKQLNLVAMDLVGNRGSAVVDVVLDDTAPMTISSHTDGTYDPEARFSFTATDEGSGVASTEYRVDGGPWTPYSGVIALPVGHHVVGFRSVDRLDNTEPERSISVRIESSSIPSLPVAEMNWKPILAGIFTVILFLIGAWSSRRAPWHLGHRPALRAFALTSAPLVAMEATTGVVSQITGALAIPPLWGVGMVVDVAILTMGVATSVYRVWSRTRA